MVGIAKKIMQLGIFVFVEVQELHLLGNLQGSKCGVDCMFLHFYIFTKKFLSI